jgi:hypothetical protein
MVIDSCNYGDWKVLHYALCKLENYEIQWYDSVRIWRPKNQRSLRCDSQSQAKDLQIWVEGVEIGMGSANVLPRVYRLEGQEIQYSIARWGRCSSSRKQRKFVLSLPLCSIWALNKLGDTCLFWGGRILFIHPTNSSGNTLTDTRKYYLTAIWA